MSPIEAPQIQVRFHTDPMSYLSCAHPFRIVIHVILRHSCPITVFKHGTILDPSAVFSLNRIEIFDCETGSKVQMASVNNTGIEYQTDVPPTPEESLLTLCEGRSSWIQFSTVVSKEGYEHLLDVSELAPDRKYTLRLRDHGIVRWFYGPKEELVGRLYSPLEFAQSETRLLPVYASNAPSFKTLSDLPQAPRVTVTLLASSEICYLSGDPPFTILTSYTSHADQPITVRTNTMFVTDGGLEILDASTKKRVRPANICMCCDEDPLLQAEDFLRLEPFIPVVVRKTLTTSGGYYDTENLESGKHYIVKIRKRFDKLKWWGYDEVEKVLKYAGDGSSLPYVPPICLVCENEFEFQPM